ncbi:FAD-dependent oxidoreductase [Micropruina sp.]|uniref:FAD-dependent oxidoreductase n=1 Tax=Micropruina sp. TaxID=2737536 RepID=UPI0039E4F9FB
MPDTGVHRMSDDPVAVVGGSLAGMAAAARLAKQRHRVVLFEAADRLGGRWVEPGVLPPAFTLPAPWRDLFRKSGRAFDAELARTGHALAPAPPATHHFADGSALTLPADRGQQWAALTDAWGRPAATRWRDLLDDLDDRWQVLRRLGLEHEFTAADLTPQRRRAVGLNQTVQQLARQIDHPQAAALLLSTAWRIGSDPARTPGFITARLALERTFGRWQLTRDGAPVPAAELIALLAARLELRGVEVRLTEPVTGIEPGLVTTASGSTRVAAVVATVNPWSYLRLAGPTEPTLRRRTRWTRPAWAASVRVRNVSQEVSTGSAGGSGVTSGEVSTGSTSEAVHHLPDGVMVEYRIPASGGHTLITHGHGAGPEDASAGTRWTSPRTWLRLPPLRAETPGVVTASASSRGGNDPWAQLLSGALATYVTHENLTGADIRPTNKAVRP